MFKNKIFSLNQALLHRTKICRKEARAIITKRNEKQYKKNIEEFVGQFFNCYKNKPEDEPDVICKGFVNIYRKDFRSDARGLNERKWVSREKNLKKIIKNDPKLITAFPAGDSIAENIFFPDDKECWISPNAYRIPEGKKNKELFRFYNIVVEVKTRISVEKQVKCMNVPVKEYRTLVPDPGENWVDTGILGKYRNVQEGLKNIVIKWGKNEGFVPNVVDFEGTNTYFWFALDPCVINSITIKSVKMIKGKILDGIRKVVKNCGFGNMCTISEKKLMSNNQLVRLPGSFDKKTETFGTYSIIHLNRMDVVKEGRKIKEPISERNMFLKEVISGKRGFYYQKHMMEKRWDTLAKDIPKLREYGLGASFYAYANILSSTASNLGKPISEPIEILKKIAHTDSSFQATDGWIEKISKDAYKNNYQYTNEKIIKLLILSETEQRKLGIFASKEAYEKDLKKRSEEAKERAKIVDQRRDTVEMLCGKDPKRSVSSIAKILNKSEDVIYADLKAKGIKAPLKMKKSVRRNKMLSFVFPMLKKGNDPYKCIDQIAEYCECCKRTVYSDLKVCIEILKSFVKKQNKKSNDNISKKDEKRSSFLNSFLQAFEPAYIKMVYRRLINSFIPVNYSSCNELC